MSSDGGSIVNDLEWFLEEFIDYGVIENVVYYDTTLSITGYNRTCPLDIIIPNTINSKTITKIGDRAFTTDNLFSESEKANEIKNYNLSNLNLISNNAQIKTILMQADGIGITSVVLPEGLQKIGFEAFKNNDLTELTIPSSVTNISEYAFINNQITKINFPTTPLKAMCYAFAGNPIEYGDYTYPSNVTFDCK